MFAKGERMDSIKINSCSFGKIVINHETYTEDVLILPDGKILERWWRKKGHQLSLNDLEDLIKTAPEVIVAGMGVSGMMRPDKDLKSEMSKMSIELIAAPNKEAIELFNALSGEKRIGAGFHLTC
jgi:hypothetical protein